MNFNDIQFHLTFEDIGRLRNAAAALGLTCAEVMRDGVLAHVRALERRRNGGKPFPLPDWRRRRRVP